MTSRDFCYWLQGFFELAGTSGVDAKQVDCIQRHLALVFKHEVDAPDPDGVLQAVHDGKPAVKPEPRPRPPYDLDTLYRC